MSLDQRVGDAITLFARYGHQLRGERMRFDRALTAGAEIGGSYWNRSGDALAFAVGRMRASQQFRAASATLDADGNGVPDYAFAAAAGESVFEAYYRYRLNKQLEFSADAQWVSQPAGDPDAGVMRFLGVRAQITY